MTEQLPLNTAQQDWWKEGYGQGYLDSRADQIGPERTDAQVAFLVEQALHLEVGSRVLDLACGNGRHSVGLSVAGYDVIGGDYSEELLAVANDLAANRGAHARFVRLDMRRLPFREAFDGIVSMFTSFGMFDEHDNAEMLKEVARALKPDGVFVIDQDSLMQRIRRAVTEGELDPATGEYRIMANYTQPSSGLGMELTLVFDPATLREKFSYRYEHKGQLVVSTGNFRRYSLPEMVHLLGDAGLSVASVWGGYDGQEYTGNSGRMIIKAVKTSTSSDS